ncbi:MAG TPA: hypothetical protein DCS93_26005 [Microscillaceae bacterium]|nr:hypothetical protein [Microscillaceae bacterium]
METKTKTLVFEYGIASELNPSQILTEQDTKCFEEIRHILQKHKAQNRFGVTLLDNEELKDNQIRLETNSIEQRHLLTNIVMRESVVSNSIQTNWTLDVKAVAACTVQCADGHDSKHQSTGGGQQVGG